MNLRIKNFILFIFIGLGVSGCGGGGGGDNPSNNPSSPGVTNPPAGGGTPTGGAGSGTLPDILYLSNSVQTKLFYEVSITPVIQGLNGRTVSCSLESGVLPNGLILNPDCSIVGIPKQAGTNFPFTIRAAISDTPGSAKISATIVVQAPESPVYLDASTKNARPQKYAFGDSVAELPSQGDWQASAVSNFSWNYSLSGSLAPGLSLNSQTGRISGAITSESTLMDILAYPKIYSAQIKATLSTPHGTFSPPAGLYKTEVEPVVYQNVCEKCILASNDAFIGMPFLTRPQFSGGGVLSDFSVSPRFSALPAGITINPANGEISGMATTLSGSSSGAPYLISAKVTKNGVATPIEFFVLISVQAPNNGPLYDMSTIHVNFGNKVSVKPSVNSVALAQAGNSLTYSVSTKLFPTALSPTPPGVTLNTATGEVSGIPTAKGSFTLYVDTKFTSSTGSTRESTHGIHLFVQ